MKHLLVVVCCGVLALAHPAPMQSQSPRTHLFTPTEFYTTYSFAHPPAVRVTPGDRVVTKTIDAGGADWTGKSVSPGGNPQTGPFYIEGAEPGDTIVVTFEKIEPNRATGYSSSLLAPYTVDPAALNARVDHRGRPQRRARVRPEQYDLSVRRVGYDCAHEHHTCRPRYFPGVGI